LKATQFAHYVIKNQPEKPIAKPLTIATPFYYSFHFLDQYLTTLLQLDYPKKLITLVFAVQGEDDTYLALKDFQSLNKHRYREIKVEKRPELMEAPYFQRLGALNVCDQRNWLKQQTHDDVLFLGHDNFAPPNTIWRLLEAQSLGGDISGGVYPFIQSLALGLTSFFLLRKHGEVKAFHCTAVLKEGGRLWFPQCLYGQRVWTWTTGMDATLIKREVLDAVDYTVTLAEDVTDDVEFCYNAHKKGFKVVTDYGLWIKHWGIDLTFLLDKPWNGWIQLLCKVQPWLIDLRNALEKLRESQRVLGSSTIPQPVIPITHR